MRTRNNTVIITGADLSPGHEYEVVVQAVSSQGLLQSIDDSPRQVIVIKGKETTPSQPSGLTATGGIVKISLAWDAQTDRDFDVMEVWRANTNSLSLATKIAETKATTWTDEIGSTGVTRYYWLRARNTSGKFSPYYPEINGVSATTSGIDATDIADFAVTATKTFMNTIVLTGDAWENNQPAGGSIRWNTHYLVYGGAYYRIAGSNTALKFVYWNPMPSGGSGTVADPYITAYTKSATYAHAANRFMVATNESGVVQLVWNASANMVVGTAFILDAAITNAKIDTMTANKLTAGTIDASVITVTNLIVGTNVAIGTAEDAAGVTTIVGNTVTTGYVDALEITALGAVTAGSLSGVTMSIGAANAIFKADANGIYLGHATFASAPFSVDMAGALIATNAAISGAITASTIDIGGDDASSFHVDTGGGIWSGASIANKATAPFRVSNAGVLVASSATITGAITATSGAIGNWVVAATGLYLDGALANLSSGMTPADYSFYAGAKYADRATAPFRVTPAGVLVASSATITGAITASSGTIGSFTIGTYLYTGSKTAYDDANAGVHLGSDGIGIGNNLFTVSAGGALVATSATITGTIQTASSGQRIVQSAGDNTLRFHTATTENVLILDDNLYSGRPGIKILSGVYGGVFQIVKTTNFELLEHKL